MSQVDPNPTPSFMERLVYRAMDTNPQYTQWAHGHNSANLADRREFDQSVVAAHAAGARDTAIEARAKAGDPQATRELHAIGVHETNLNKNLPPNATKMGTLEQSNEQGGSPIRDINTVTVDGKSWGFVYRTEDGTLMVQRDTASIPLRSTTTSIGGGASAGVAKDPFTLQVNGSYSYATTLTDPAQQAVVKLTDPDKQLPDGALVSPLRDEIGKTLPGSSQLLPANPHLHENQYDRAKPAPERFEYNLAPDMYGMATPQDKPYATFAMNRAGEASVAVRPAAEMERTQSQSVGLG